MNPLTITRNITKLNEREISLGIKENASWHNEYKDSAWIFVGGLSFELTEGDVLCTFSQCGEIVNINLVRDKATGKSKGFCFICYEDQRSTILAVDNMNGIKLCSRIIRVDHVAKYRIPKEDDEMDEETLKLHKEGCAPAVMIKEPLAREPTLKKRKHENDRKSDVDEKDNKHARINVKTERKDPGYDKYEIPNTSDRNGRTRHSGAVANQPQRPQNQHKSEKDTAGSSSKHKKSKHSSKDGHRSHKHHDDTSDSDEKTHKHKSHKHRNGSSDSNEKTHKHSSHKHRSDSSDTDEKTHKHKSRSKHSKHRH